MADTTKTEIPRLERELAHCKAKAERLHKMVRDDLISLISGRWYYCWCNCDSDPKPIPIPNDIFYGDGKYRVDFTPEGAAGEWLDRWCWVGGKDNDSDANHTPDCIARPGFLEEE